MGGVCYKCGERKENVHVCRGDVWVCDDCCYDGKAGTGYCSREVEIKEDQLVNILGKFEVRIRSLGQDKERTEMSYGKYAVIEEKHSQGRLIGTVPQGWIKQVISDA